MPHQATYTVTTAYIAGKVAINYVTGGGLPILTVFSHQAADKIITPDRATFKPQVLDFAAIDTAEQTQKIITDSAVIYGQTYYLMVVSVKDTGKGRAVKSPTGIIDIRGDNGGGVGSPGQIDIGLQAGESRPVIRVSRKLVKIR
jgi:hypothetical protein